MQPAGALVIDTQRNKLGHVMGYEGPYVQLRPVAGGREWDADPTRVRPAVDTSTMSAECALAHQPGHTGLHRDCRQTRDIHPPHGAGILQARRTCPCHTRTAGTP